MAPRSGDEPNHGFPAGIGKPATRALVAAGYTNLEQLSRVTESELLKLHGMGPIEALYQQRADPFNHAAQLALYQQIKAQTATSLTASRCKRASRGTHD